MISYVVFWIYSLFVIFPVLSYDIWQRDAGIWTLISVAVWTVLVLIKLTPTGALIPQYVSFCKYRLHKPERLLPKMSFKQIVHLMSVKELDADFDYVQNTYGDGELYKASYYNFTEKDESRSFVRCAIKDSNKNKIVLNPATYLDYLRMCHLVKKGIASICPDNTVDAQLANLNAIRDVLRDVQDKETAKIQSVASENQEIESRIISDRKAKIKAK